MNNLTRLSIRSEREESEKEDVCAIDDELADLSPVGRLAGRLEAISKLPTRYMIAGS